MDKIGVLVSATDSATFVPLLVPEFQVHMPSLNLWWSLALLLTVIKLIYGRWTVVLRWTDLGLRVLGIYILVSLILGGPLLRAEAGWGGLDNPLWGSLSRVPEIVILAAGRMVVLLLVVPSKSNSPTATLTRAALLTIASPSWTSFPSPWKVPPR